jgi:tetratricopeptide (TPR) repeat protein
MVGREWFHRFRALHESLAGYNLFHSLEQHRFLRACPVVPCGSRPSARASSSACPGVLMDTVMDSLSEEALEQGIAWRRAGKSERAIAAFGQALCSDDPEYVARGHYQLSMVHRTLGQWEAALAHAFSARDEARRAGSIALECEALNAEGACYWQQGRTAEAEAVFMEILTRAAPDDMKSRGLALSNLGGLTGDAGDFERAREFFSAAYECLVVAEYVPGSLAALHNLGAVKLDMGILDEALADFTRVKELAFRAGNLELAGIASMNMAEAIAKGGSPQKADFFLSQAVGEFSVGNNHFRRCFALGVFAQIAVLQGDLELAVHSYRRAVEIAREWGFQELERRFQARLAEMDWAE